MSNFVVSARKYRPKHFDDVVGQKHVSDTLKMALQSDKVAHAYLFCGPRGVGKTTCARILAKVVNCENPIDKHTPCNNCASCKSFENNASFNIIELDAASNNGVEHVRSLIEQVRIQPQQGKFKIFIIDEVHMLSQSAFNAFLKTLEEPPPYVIFIMATTEKHKILPTILSRCQIYDFKRIQANDIVPQLNFILEQEGKTADPEALSIIGQKADGAMRDALSIFDRIASSSGDHISYKDVVDNLNILDFDYFFSITDCLLQGQLGEILLQYDQILHKGFEGDQLIYGLSEHFRNLMMLAFPQTINLLDVGDKLLERYKAQSSLVRNNLLMSWLHIANEADIQYGTAKNKRLHTEICLSKMVYAAQLIQSSELSLEKKTKVSSEAPVGDRKVSDNEGVVSTGTVKQMASAPAASSSTQVEADSTDSKAVIEEPSKSTADALNKTPQNETETGGPAIKNIKRRRGAKKQVTFQSFNKVEDEIRKTELEGKEQIALTQEAVERKIADYVETSIQSNSIKQVFSIIKVEVAENGIQIYVPSVIAQESVTMQDNLMIELRQYFNRSDLAIPVVIDVDKFPNYSSPVTKTKKSEVEIYQEMLAQNVLVGQLQKAFDLQPD